MHLPARFTSAWPIMKQRDENLEKNMYARYKNDKRQYQIEISFVNKYKDILFLWLWRSVKLLNNFADFFNF
jgi:hypothetical protein